MLLPNIPPITLGQAINHLVESMALEDAAWAYVVHSVSESLQGMTASATAAEMTKARQEVERILRVVAVHQVLAELRQGRIKELQQLLD
jgi:hypothetical protein